MEDQTLQLYKDFFRRYSLPNRLRTYALWLLIIPTVAFLIYFLFGWLVIDHVVCMGALAMSLFCYVMSRAADETYKPWLKEADNEAESSSDERRDESSN